DPARRRHHRGIAGADRVDTRRRDPCRARGRGAPLRGQHAVGGVGMTTVGEARAFAAELLHGTGVPADPAHRTAELLVLADVWGIGSHGLMRLPYYLARLTAGGLNSNATLKPVRAAGAAMSLD